VAEAKRVQVLTLDGEQDGPGGRGVKAGQGRQFSLEALVLEGAARDVGDARGVLGEDLGRGLKPRVGVGGDDLQT
jgi:hypothetical protein